MSAAISPVSIVIDVATGLIAVTFLWSGLAKLRSPDRTLKAMNGLGVPAVLKRRWLARLLPIVEIALGLVLLCAPGVLRLLGTAAAGVLLSVFLFLVTRAVSRGVEVACECFGSASRHPVDRFTVVRNALLVVCALIATGAGPDAPGLVLSITPVTIWASVVTLAFVSVIALAVRQHRHITRLRAVINQHADRYRRVSEDALTGSPIPDAELVGMGGVTTALAELGRGRAVLLIFTKAGCGDCAAIARLLPEWERRLHGAVVPIIASSSRPEQLFADYPEFADRTYFGAHAARASLGIRMLPSAVLLAADARSVATEPVEGSSAISELATALIEQAERQFRAAKE